MGGGKKTFIVWGITYFALIAFEKSFAIPGRLGRAGRVIYRILTLFIINIEWVIFRSESLTDALHFIKGMFLTFGNEEARYRAVFLLKDYSVFIIAAVIFSTPIVSKLRILCERHKVTRTVYCAGEALIVSLLFIWSISFIVAGANNPFAYANF